MMIPEDKVEEVKAATDIVDVVSDYVRLKKAGSNFKGLCPFHNEKTPSFNVNPSMGIFKCFGCSEGGDAISFLMKVEGLGFTETVRMLAERAGIDLPEEGAQDPHADEKEGILHALRFAARFYFDQLTKTDEGQRRGLAYFESRGLSKETIKRFGLGYAPDRWDGLLKAAEAAQIKPEILDAAGLVLPNKNGDGFHDRFRERAMFPILSHVGKVLGFGGRVLPDSKPPTGDYVPPKYINSPETRVYHKSRVLYGLYQGKQAIRGAEEVILVEGYTDVISLHQADVKNVVASSGTALTPEQVRMLSRYAKRAVLLFDADSAGSAAALRAIGPVVQSEMEAMVVVLPEGADPDSFVQQFGGEAFRSYIYKHRRSFVDFQISQAQREGRLGTPEGQNAVAEQILTSLLPLLDDRRNFVRWEGHLRNAAQLLKIPDIHLRKQFPHLVPSYEKQRDRAEQNRPNPTLPPPDEEAPPAPRSKTSFQMRPEEGALIRLMLQHGRPMVEHVLSHTALDEFSRGPVRETVQLLLAQYEQGAIRKDDFTGGTHGPLIQKITAGVLVDRHVPSENYARKGINVPKFNDEPFEAAASAMTLLKLDRVNEAIALVNRRTYAAEQAGEDLTPLQEQMQQLQRLRGQIERREFFDWNREQRAS